MQEVGAAPAVPLCAARGDRAQFPHCPLCLAQLGPTVSQGPWLPRALLRRYRRSLALPLPVGDRQHEREAGPTGRARQCGLVGRVLAWDSGNLGAIPDCHCSGKSR